MPTLKPFQVIIMGIFGLVALLGIVLFANFQGFTGGVQQVGQVVIWGTLPKDDFSVALETVRQTHQELAQVSYSEVPQATFDTELAEAIASGNGPDLVVLSQEDLVAAMSKLNVIPSSSLSERDYYNQFLPITTLFLTTGGTYGIPLVVDPLVLYYNRQTLATAGAAQPPSTWEAVTGLAARVNRQTDTQTILQSLIALGTYDNVENARGILSLLFLQAGYKVSDYTSSGLRATLTDMPASSKSFGSTPAESALNFYTEFANPTKTVYSWNRSLPNSRQAFTSGDLALYLGFASEQSGLARENPNLDFDMAPAPVPGTAVNRVTYGKAYAFAIPRASQNANGALRVAFIFSDKDTSAVFAKALGMAPANRAALTTQPDDFFEQVFYPEALVAQGWLSPAPADTDRIFGTMVGNVLSGREAVSTALSTASQALNAAFK